MLKVKLLAASLCLVSSLSWAAEHTVEMKNRGEGGSMVFEPAVLHVDVGDTVHFVPTQPAHNSASVAGLIPEGATPWKGGMSQKVSITVDKEGVYVYQCDPHSIMAMVGVVVAGKPINLEQIKSDSASFQSSFLRNKKRLGKYLAQIDQNVAQAN